MNIISERYLTVWGKSNWDLTPLKCKFHLKEVCYVGHLFTRKGLKRDSAKTKAINEIPTPENVTAPQRFLWMINYLGKFIPNFSEPSIPLCELTWKYIQWHWLKQLQDAFALKKTKKNQPNQSIHSQLQVRTVTSRNPSHASDGTWSCMPSGRCPNRLLLSYSGTDWDALCADQGRASWCCLHMFRIHQNWSSAISHNPKQMYTRSSSQIAAHDAETAKVQLPDSIQRRLTDADMLTFCPIVPQLGQSGTVMNGQTTRSCQSNISFSRLTELREQTASDPDLQKLQGVQNY